MEMARHLRSIAATGAEYWWHNHRYQLVAQALAQGHPRPSTVLLGNRPRLLDFGCGSGTFLDWYSRQHGPFELYGYDPEPLPGGRASHLQLLPAWPPMGDAKFEAITSLDVLEHIADDRSCLAGLVDALRPNGKLIITVPALQFFWSSWDQRLGHYRRYDRAGLRRLLVDAGLEVEELTYFFSFLWPPALARRMFDRGHADGEIAEFAPLPPLLNRTLRGLGRIERWLLSVPGMPGLPFGTSLFATAKKPAGRST